MAILIGDSGDVAIEIELETGVAAEHRRWLFGKIAFWFAGCRVGNANDATALTVIHAALPELRKFAGKRRDDELFAMTAADAFAIIHGALYDADVDELSYAEIRELAERNERFHALPASEAFDGWSAYLVESVDKARALVRRPDGQLLDLAVSPGALDDALATLASEVDKLAAQT